MYRALVLRRVAAMLVCFAAMTSSSTAFAQEDAECPDDFRRWVTDCAARSDVMLAGSRCADGVAVVGASADGASVEIELSTVGPRASFVRVGNVGLSPIGDFDDWSRVSPGMRRGLDAVRACVAAQAPDLSGVGAPRRLGAELSGATWRTFLALAALVAWLALALASARRAHLDAAIAVTLSIGVAVARRFVVDAAFFHQNGHGAEWVEQALCGATGYGPGYASVFQATARAAGRAAERGVFATQEMLAAIAVAAIYVIARRLAAPRPVAVALTLAVGIDPLLARLARSESYFALSLWLLTMALAALALRGRRTRAPRFWLAVALAAVLLSIAVTVHPVAWVPVACAPAVLVLGKGRRSERWIATFGALVVVVVVGCALSLGPVLDVMYGSLGRQWGGQAPRGASALALVACLSVPWACSLAPRRLAVWLAPCGVMAATIAADRMTNLFGPESTMVPADAWRLLFRVTALVAATAIVVRLTSRARRPFVHAPVIAAIAIAVLGIVHAAWTFENATTLPTDALETQRLATELQSLPANARLHYLEGSDRMHQRLPLYPACGVTRIRVVGESLRHPPRPIMAGDYWLRAATCSTADGRPYCDEIERHLVLRAIDVAHLPARPSLPYLPYDADDVVSGLYHVEALRDP